MLLSDLCLCAKAYVLYADGSNRAYLCRGELVSVCRDVCVPVCLSKCFKS